MSKDKVHRNKFKFSDYISVSYFWNNIKSTKGVIIILAMLLIAVNAIFIFVKCNSDSSELLVIQLEHMSYPALFGLYVYPFVMSALLFSFLFKKKSVDFMCSMPISRRKMYISNIVDGIVIVVLLNLINTLVIAATMYATPNCVSFSQLFVDYFVAWTCYYILFFVVSSLALLLVGNVSTGIIVYVLMITLIPSFMAAIHEESAIKRVFVDVSDYEDYGLWSEEEEPNIKKVEDNQFRGIAYNDETYEESMGILSPINFVEKLFSGYRYYKVYIEKHIIISCVCSVIGVFIGSYIFSKRKMEIAGNSFGKAYIHYIVKAMTLIPMIVFIGVREVLDSDILFAIIIVLILIYYCLYDHVTSFKNGRIRYSVICGLVAIGVSVLLLNVATRLSYSVTLTEGTIVFDRSEIQSANVAVDSIHGAVNISNGEFIDEICNIIEKKHENELAEHWYGMSVGFTLKDGTLITMDDFVVSKETAEKLKEIVIRNSIDKDVLSDISNDFVYIRSNNCYENYIDAKEFVRCLNNVEELEMGIIPFDKYVYSEDVHGIGGFVSYDSMERMLEDSEMHFICATYDNHKISINELKSGISQYTMQLTHEVNNKKIMNLIESGKKFTISDSLLTFYKKGERVTRQVDKLEENQGKAIVEYISDNRDRKYDENNEHFVLTFYVNIHNTNEDMYCNYVIPKDDKFINWLKDNDMFTYVLDEIVE